MRGSLKLARLFGINVYVHWTFGILVAWILFMAFSAGETVGGAMWALAFVALLFFCIVLHEYGHALTARRYGIPTRDITLLPIGGVARLERMPEDPWQELVVAAAGPAVNVVIAALLAGILAVLGNGSILAGLEVSPLAGQLLLANGILVAFNILPAFPMDGGRMFRALLAMKWDYAKATHIAASVGQGMAILFGLAALMVPGTFIVLGFVGLFIFFAARHEAQAVRVRWLIRGIPVRRAMMTDFRPLSANDPLHVAAMALLAGSQHDFPVLDEDGTVVGLLRRDDLVKGVEQGSIDAPVESFMRSDLLTADEETMLADIVRTMQERNQTNVPVLRNGRLVGLLTADNVSEVMMLQAARARRDELDSHEEPVEPMFDREERDPFRAADSESWTAGPRGNRIRSDR